jgi:hypothetical protein
MARRLQTPLFLALLPRIAAASEGGAHSTPIAQVALALVIILLVAKLGGRAASRLGLPPVLGELMAGVFLGNLSLLGFSGLELSRPTLLWIFWLSWEFCSSCFRWA